MGWAQAQLATKIGDKVSPTQVSKWERNEFSPSRKYLDKIYKLLGHPDVENYIDRGNQNPENQGHTESTVEGGPMQNFLIEQVREWQQAYKNENRDKERLVKYVQRLEAEAEKNGIKIERPSFFGTG